MAATIDAAIEKTLNSRLICNGLFPVLTLQKIFDKMTRIGIAIADAMTIIHVSGTHSVSRQNINRRNEMEMPTRAQLEAAHVEAGVAKWGETERDGLTKQAKKRSIESLRVDWAVANGMSNSEAMEKFGGKKSYNIAKSAIENGAS